MPMRNGGPFVREAVESLLDQGAVPLEVVIVDDGSTDGSPDTVRAIGDERVRLVPGPQRGNAAAAVNAGINAARGEYFLRCDADDRFTPGRVHRQVAWLADHPECVALCGGFEVVGPDGKLVSELHTGDEEADITEEMHGGITRTHLGTFCARMQAVRDIGGLRQYFVGTEDIDLQLRLASAGRIHYRPDNDYVYRLHEASSTHTQASNQREFLTQTARDFAVQRRDRPDGLDDLMRGDAPAVPEGTGRESRVNDQVQRLLLGKAWKEQRAGNRQAAMDSAWRGCLHRPFNADAWRQLAMISVKPVKARQVATSDRR